MYWTYGYSPVRDDDGRIAGVLVVVQETTAYVKAQAERESLLKAEREARVDAERARAEALSLPRNSCRARFRRLPLPSPSRWDPRIDSFWRIRATSNSSAGRSRWGRHSVRCFRDCRTGLRGVVGPRVCERRAVRDA